MRSKIFNMKFALVPIFKNMIVSIVNIIVFFMLLYHWVTQLLDHAPQHTEIHFDFLEQDDNNI